MTEPRPDVPNGTKVRMSGKELEFGVHVVPLRDANDLAGDVPALRRRLQEDGYLLLRGFHDREQVLSARRQVLQYLRERKALKHGTPLEEGIIGPDNKGLGFSHEVVMRFSSFLDVVNSPRLLTFFGDLLGGQAMSLDHKWLRAVPRGVNTSVHYDRVFMGGGTLNLYTVWTPLGDISLDMGPLAVCLGSHRLEKLKATYGASDTHRDLTPGWFSNDPHELIDLFGIQWATSPFRAGDAMIFGMHFLHASLENVSNRYRLSSDTRYQRANEPVDIRHMGRHPDRIPKSRGTPKTFQQARAEWGF